VGSPTSTGSPTPTAGSPAPIPTGRLAPSPTGLLHLGHARSFLLAWWHARARGGRVLLRIEDLDRERVKTGMTEACLRDLEWLGLDWDGPVVQQSRDTRAIEAALGDLLARGLAYACTCSRRDLELALSAPQAGDGAAEGETRYPGTCRARFTSPAEAARATGRPAGIRFRVPPGVVALEDGLAGRFAHDVEAECGDFLIARRDGAFAYQLAVVVDDARMGVTEVVRGEDLLASTARQWLLQEALGLPHPAWLHVPLVVDERGERLAKRRGSTTLAELRAAGVDPRSIVAWVARSAGLERAEPARPQELVTSFDLRRVPRGAVRSPAGRLDSPPTGDSLSGPLPR
jgi:glutamyl-tRNA synthetase